MKILLIEDDRVIREDAWDLLEKHGHEVLTSPDGDMAIYMARENSDFDIVICDFNMPEKDGLETLRLIRKRRPGLRAWLTSTSLDDLKRIHDDAKRMGVEELVSKARPDFFEKLKML